ncbi:MAG: protein kinase, partial [Planctomycetota bacterium]
MIASSECSSKCPSRESLIDLIDERLDPPLRDTVATHIDRCQTCRDALEELSTDPRYTDARFARHRNDREATASQPEWLQRVQALGPPPLDDTNQIDQSWRSLLDPPSSDNEVGRLGKFAILDVIGQGGMGIVLRGKDSQLGRPVAIKIIRPTSVRNDDLRDRFLNEAKVMATIDHPHVTPIYEVGCHLQTPFIVMKLLEGESLNERLRRKRTLDNDS